MKTIKLLVLVFVAFTPFTGCSPEDDIKNSDLKPYLFYEEFLSVKEETEGDPLNIAGWTNFAEAGTVKWNQGFYNGTKYAEFTSYQSNQASNIAWLVSPKIDMDLNENEKLVFDVAQAYVSSSSNSIELLFSKNYDGTNVTSAVWTPISFTKPPLDYDTNFDFFSSGKIDLSNKDVFKGKIHFAFKCKGSGTNNSLDGTYEIDNVRIFNEK